ncbi:TetR/AcrR family transcriptional regulator [Microbacterium jejuense]
MSKAGTRADFYTERVPAPTLPGPSGRRFDVDVLLDAAREIFYIDGFARAQIVDIARAAGTTKPTLYARLGNKERIHEMVVRREADVFRSQVAVAYERGGDLPLRELARSGMEPLFHFARERPSGFHVLFLGDSPSAEVVTIRREVVEGVIEQLDALIRRRQKVLGAELGESSDLIAAACVGLARQVCERAIARGDDLFVAQDLAARFVENAIRNLNLAGGSRRSEHRNHPTG